MSSSIDSSSVFKEGELEETIHSYLAISKSKLISDLIYRKRVTKDNGALRAFLEIPREAFVNPYLAGFSYDDIPINIGCDQMISQPSLVVYMLHQLEVLSNHKVLEIGAGSGYNAALLSRMSKKVISTEIIPELANLARSRMSNFGLDNVLIVDADIDKIGYEKEAPYDRIIVTATAPDIPNELIDQLTPDGIMIIPIGKEFSMTTSHVMYKIIKKNGIYVKTEIDNCRFVPLRYGEFRDLDINTIKSTLEE